MTNPSTSAVEQMLAKLLTKALTFNGILGQPRLAVPVETIQKELAALQPNESKGGDDENLESMV